MKSKLPCLHVPVVDFLNIFNSHRAQMACLRVLWGNPATKLQRFQKFVRKVCIGNTVGRKSDFLTSAKKPEWFQCTTSIVMQWNWEDSPESYLKFVWKQILMSASFYSSNWGCLRNVRKLCHFHVVEWEHTENWTDCWFDQTDLLKFICWMGKVENEASSLVSYSSVLRPTGPCKSKVDMADQINCLQMYVRLDILMQEYWPVVQIYCPWKLAFLSGTLYLAQIRKSHEKSTLQIVTLHWQSPEKMGFSFFSLNKQNRPAEIATNEQLPDMMN